MRQLINAIHFISSAVVADSLWSMSPRWKGKQNVLLSNNARSWLATESQMWTDLCSAGHKTSESYPGCYVGLTGKKPSWQIRRIYNLFTHFWQTRRKGGSPLIIVSVRWTLYLSIHEIMNLIGRWLQLLLESPFAYHLEGLLVSVTSN